MGILRPLGDPMRSCTLCAGPLVGSSRTVACVCGLVLHERCAAEVLTCPGCGAPLRNRLV